MTFDAMSFDPRTSFGPRVAATYDDVPRGDESSAVGRLAELAGHGPALEFAIGTGRLALPLAATGVRVDGIELSSAVVEQLRAKQGGASLTVACGDMAVVEMAERYRLVYIAFNSLMNLIAQNEQVQCIANAGRIDSEGATVEIGRFDRVTQRVDKCHLGLSASGIALDPLALRYVWPSELDLVARLTGLRLLARWGGWVGEPFDSRSVRHVSVYGRDPES